MKKIKKQIKLWKWIKQSKMMKYKSSISLKIKRKITNRKNKIKNSRLTYKKKSKYKRNQNKIKY